MALIAAMYGCNTSKPSPSDSPDTETDISHIEALPEISVSASPQKTKRVSATKEWILHHTQLVIKPEILYNRMEGEAMIWLSPYAVSPTQELALDAKFLNIESVSLCQNPISYTYQKELSPERITSWDKSPYRLNIKLPSNYNRGDTLCIKIKYTVTPDSVPDGEGSVYIRERKGIYMLHPDSQHAKRPTQLWTQGEPESSSFWFPTLDAPNQKTTQVIRVHFPSDMTSLSNGLRVSSTSTATTTTDTWVHKLPISPYLFTLVVGDFYIDSSGRYKDKSLSYMTDPDFGEYAQINYDHTPEMIAYFEQLTGVPFVWPKYSQVIVHDFVTGAMENASAVTFGDFIQKNDRALLDAPNDGIVAHELFHHWFGNLVTFESWNHISLSESFATLGALLWQGHKGGPEVEAHERYKMFQRYIKVARQDEPPLLREFYKKPGEVFDRISYQKGATVLYMLRAQIGEEMFSAAMKHFLETHAYGNAELEDWRQSLETVTGSDFKLFFDEWYYAPGVPRLRVAVRDYDSLQIRRLTVSYADSSAVYDLSTDLRIKASGIDSVRRLTISDSVQYWDFDYVSGRAPHLILDPEHILAAMISYSCPDSYWEQMLEISNHYEDVRNALENLKDLKTGGLQLSLAQIAVKNIRGSSLLATNTLEPSSIADPIYKDKLNKILSNNQNDPLLRAAIVSKLAKINTPENTSWLKQYCSDTSYAVCAEALEALDSLDHDYAISYAADSLQYVHGDLYKQCLIILSSEDSITHLPLLLDEVISNYGQNCFTPCFYLNKALLHVQQLSDFSRGVDVLINKAAHDDLQDLNEYVLKNLYNNYIELSKKEDTEKAQYIKSQIQEKVYPAWNRPERVEDLQEVYNWQVKF